MVRLPSSNERSSSWSSSALASLFLEKRCRDRAIDPDLNKRVKAVPLSSSGTGACDRPIQKTKDAKAVTMNGGGVLSSVTAMKEDEIGNY
nr:hypothetical protein [Tanacetum cinerariifolium]